LSTPWHKISDQDLQQLSVANPVTLSEVAGKKFCIALYNDKLFAFAFRCPHAGVSLANGYVDVRGNIVCPVHQYRFNIQTGRNVSGEDYHLKTYKTEAREDGVYIQIDIDFPG
jgi:nitrite reductase/ring-hydroxylating ferredoxin subunit